MAKTNADYLRDHISNNDEAVEFLDAILSDHKDEIDELEKELIDYEQTVEDKDKEIADLENQLGEAEDMHPCSAFCEVIEAGIGTIEYVEPDNLLLQQIMEAFAIRVKDNPNGLLKLLS